MSAPILEISDLRVTVPGPEGEARILDHVDLALPRGRILGIVGESGCGKTTLLRAVLGVLPPRSRVERGRIQFDGQDLLAMDEAALRRRVRGRGIGFIPQDPMLAFNPVFTLGDQLLAQLRAHTGLGARARRAHLLTMLRKLRLHQPEALLDRYPHEVSGGQRQRLLIAGVLAVGPPLIVADEPTTALDAVTQLRILALLRRLVAEHALSLLFVTHDLAAAAQLCDGIGVMYAGQMVETGPVRAVLAAPSHPYTTALLACHPDRAHGFRGIPGQVPSPTAAPPGCRFAARCGEARAACTTRSPRLRPVGADHLADCHLFDP